MTQQPFTPGKVGRTTGSTDHIKLAAEVHKQDDVDRDALAHHHTLGWGVNQAAPGSEALAKITAATDVVKVTQAVVKSFAGSWPTSAPGPTSGTPFTVDFDGRLYGVFQCSAWATSGPMYVRMYIDGVAWVAAGLASNTVANARVTLMGQVVDYALTKGTHYLALQQTNGTSDAADTGTFFGFMIGNASQGPPGPQGPIGLTGPQGPAGGTAGTQGFTFTQASPSAMWTINHTLPFIPNVSIVDSSGNEVEGDVKQMSSTQVIVTFSAAFAGTAYLS